MNYLTMKSPLGTLKLVSHDRHLVRIDFPGAIDSDAGEASATEPTLLAARSQLEEYFAGRRQRFELPLAPTGTPFQCDVWQVLQRIPYGELRSYSDVASALGRPTAVRAVGAANGRNPLPIVVPCHRVVGKDGSLTGFAGGLDTKQWLIQLEASTPQLFS